MRTFHCQFCGHPVFFENVACVRCGSALAFLPDRLQVAAIEPVDAAGPDSAAGETLWRPRSRDGMVEPRRYRRCRNHTAQSVCNFAVPEGDPNVFCAACRLTRVLPDLSQPGNPRRWYLLEQAKRRLFYTLARIGLLNPCPAHGRTDGPLFEFLVDQPGQPVLTGHAHGVITINAAEADETERTRRKEEMHEPYRTLLGHFRHESGHYYWDRLIDEGGRIAGFRRHFGDERLDYAQALQDHYARGSTLPGWQDRHVSAYASAHPWEDWAETWAHYLHMVDLLETAASYQMRLTVPGEPAMAHVLTPRAAGHASFDALVQQWVPLTLLVNSLNRSLGQDDAYPFAMSSGALEKLRYVHDVIQGAEH